VAKKIMETAMTTSARTDATIASEVVSDDSICLVHLHFVCGEKEPSN